MTTIDRTALEKAIQRVANLEEMLAKFEWVEAREQRKSLLLLLAAARAHLESLPKTAMVGVWHTEMALHTEGRWRPSVNAFLTKEEANDSARALGSLGARCVRVTGPHQQEIPCE